MHSSMIEVVLDYQVAAPSHLVFNLEAARCGSQTVASESLAIEPPVEVRAYCDKASGNRFIRFDAQPGPLKLRYRADVQRGAVDVPGNLAELPVNQVPDDILQIGRASCRERVYVLV